MAQFLFTHTSVNNPNFSTVHIGTGDNLVSTEKEFRRVSNSNTLN